MSRIPSLEYSIDDITGLPPGILPDLPDVDSLPASSSSTCNEWKGVGPEPASRSAPVRDPTYSRLTETDNESSPQPKQVPLPVPLQAGMMIGVIVLGCADIISRQIVAKCLKRFSYMLSLATALTYVPMYFLILGILIKMRIIPRAQLDWAWTGRWRQGWDYAPPVKLYMIAALGDALGDTFGYICTPYVAGPIHSLLAQCTIMFTVLLSFCVLGSRYSLHQCLGLLGIEVAVVAGVIPSLGKGSNSTNVFFATLLGGSCFFNALAFVMKEWSFGIYKKAPPPTEDQNSTLNIFIVNSHESLFQLPFTLLLVPLAQATGQTKGEGVLAYLREGVGCLIGDTTQGPECEFASKWTMLYVFFNISWNLLILLNVKVNGALATFVALKAIFPISAVLFAYVDWPMLHTTPVHTMTWVVLVLIMPCICFYMWASIKQRERGEKGTCCWPLSQTSRHLAGE